MYQPRTYRHWVKDEDLVSFKVTVKETDLYLRAQRNLQQEALRAILRCRLSLEDYIENHPIFLTALEPLPVPQNAPKMIREMAEAAQRVGVGPMAAVAGAIAENVGREFSRFLNPLKKSSNSVSSVLLKYLTVKSSKSVVSHSIFIVDN